MRFAPLVALVLLALPVASPATAQTSSCADFLAAQHAFPPAAPDEPAQDCVLRHAAAFMINEPAAQQAQPVTDATQLYGTWLGDDVAFGMAGLMTPGQEVLRISPGAAPDTLRVEQLWFKTRPPPNGSMPWDQTGRFTNIVSEAVLELRGNGRFEAALEPPIRYFPARLQYRRVNELIVLGQLNRFEAGGTVKRADATLLISSDSFPNPFTPKTPLRATFTRVTEAAPETALALVDLMDQSQIRYFDCLTHQISAGQGPLLEAIAPETPEGLAQTTRAAMALQSRIQTTRQALMARPDEDRETLRAQMGSLMQELIAQNENPLFQRLVAAFETESLGCPNPSGF